MFEWLNQKKKGHFFRKWVSVANWWFETVFLFFCRALQCTFGAKNAGISENVGKTIINHPPNHHKYIGGIKHSQMGLCSTGSCWPISFRMPGAVYVWMNSYRYWVVHPHQQVASSFTMFIYCIYIYRYPCEISIPISKNIRSHSDYYEYIIIQNSISFFSPLLYSYILFGWIIVTSQRVTEIMGLGRLTVRFDSRLRPDTTTTAWFT